jgi:hypothetical protein
MNVFNIVFPLFIFVLLIVPTLICRRKDAKLNISERNKLIYGILSSFLFPFSLVSLDLLQKSLYWKGVLCFTLFISSIVFVECYRKCSRANTEAQTEPVFSTIKELIFNIVYKCIWILSFCEITFLFLFCLNPSIKNQITDVNLAVCVIGWIITIIYTLFYKHAFLKLQREK